MSSISPELIESCRNKLLQAKEDVLNRVKNARNEILSEDKGGDEGDQTMRALQESEFLRMNERLRKQLVEIEMALAMAFVKKQKSPLKKKD